MLPLRQRRDPPMAVLRVHMTLNAAIAENRPHRRLFDALSHVRCQRPATAAGRLSPSRRSIAEPSAQHLRDQAWSLLTSLPDPVRSAGPRSRTAYGEAAAPPPFPR